MAAKWFELVTGSLDQKKNYRQYVARIDALPEPYDTVAKALQRYLTYYGGIVDGETTLKMLGDFVDLWERAAADGTSVHAIVGLHREAVDRQGTRPPGQGGRGGRGGRGRGGRRQRGAR